MYNTKDILTLLEQGKTIEEIGEQFAATLNEAKTAYETLQKEKEVEVKRAQNRREDMRDLLASFALYCEEYIQDEEYLELVKKNLAEMEEDDETVDKLCDSLESIVEIAKSMEKMTQLSFPEVRVSDLFGF